MDGYVTEVPSGRELDREVAEKVMNNSHWIREAPDATCSADGRCDGFGPGGQCSSCTGIIAVDAPHYSTSIAAAWQVVDKMRERFGWTAPLWHAQLADIVSLSASEAAERICRAALAAVEHPAPTDASA